MGLKELVYFILGFLFSQDGHLLNRALHPVVQFDPSAYIADIFLQYLSA